MSNAPQTVVTKYAEFPGKYEPSGKKGVRKTADEVEMFPFL
jgi:hypothetical protein